MLAVRTMTKGENLSSSQSSFFGLVFGSSNAFRIFTSETAVALLSNFKRTVLWSDSELAAKILFQKTQCGVTFSRLLDLLHHLFEKMPNCVEVDLSGNQIFLPTQMNTFSVSSALLHHGF